jgi:hypothetical protein
MYVVTAIIQRGGSARSGVAVRALCNGRWPKPKATALSLFCCLDLDVYQVELYYSRALLYYYITISASPKLPCSSERGKGIGLESTNLPTDISLPLSRPTPRKGLRRSKVMNERAKHGNN